jgi:hypothetical protein
MEHSEISIFMEHEEMACGGGLKGLCVCYSDPQHERHGPDLLPLLL